jgi:hypothetical protein
MWLRISLSRFQLTFFPIFLISFATSLLEGFSALTGWKNKNNRMTIVVEGSRERAARESCKPKEIISVCNLPWETIRCKSYPWHHFLVVNAIEFLGIMLESPQ